MPRRRALVSPDVGPVVSWLVPVCLAVALVLGTGPVARASSPARRTSVLGQGSGTSPVVVDTTDSAAGSRRASYAWRGRTIRYYESVPAMWDWSLSTAINKWNGAGGGIRFVRTAKRRTAQLSIAYGATGTAAGMATVGRTRRAFVRLSSSYRDVDALDAFNRVQVLGVFTHELGHVLGFGHTSTGCSLMSPVLDVSGCGVLPASLPGYYACRTIDAPLAARFVRLYGGRARTPGTWCPVDRLPPALGGVAFSGGAGAPVAVRWAQPALVPAGSQMVVRSWETDACGEPPPYAATERLPVADGIWQRAPADPVVAEDASAAGTESAAVAAAPSAVCVSVQLVNRYGAGRAAVSGLVAGR